MENTAESLINSNLAADLTLQVGRRWNKGDIYAPHDLSSVENMKWKRQGRNKPNVDVLDVLDFNPMEHYRVGLTSAEDFGIS